MKIECSAKTRDPVGLTQDRKKGAGFTLGPPLLSSRYSRHESEG
jgi:hypothetical protein